MSFAGFSEEDLKRIKSVESSTTNEPSIITSNVKKTSIGLKPKRVTPQYKLELLKKQNSDEAIDSIDFEKCKLSIKTPLKDKEIKDIVNEEDKSENMKNEFTKKEEFEQSFHEDSLNNQRIDSRKNSSDIAPDLLRTVDDYSEDTLASHRAKLEELQLKQKLMEEQNKKRKEMLAKALADRTKQTEEEVMRLEKIKKELQILDGQFSQDVAVLRKKIDQACLTYADAEKHYLKIEKEFLQAKINLQKEKEKKELLTEHLCALITHNETRKAQKLETLMLQLASDRKASIGDVISDDDDEKPVIIDGVDQRTGKMVEFNSDSV